jgi:hypothetical protein
LPLFADRLPESRKRKQFNNWIEKYQLGEQLAKMRELQRDENTDWIQSPATDEN